MCCHVLRTNGWHAKGMFFLRASVFQHPIALWGSHTCLEGGMSKTKASKPAKQAFPKYAAGLAWPHF